jgi:hypothetical protein
VASKAIIETLWGIKKMAVATHYLYQCKHCTKRFATDKLFLKHECKEMKRIKEVRSPLGIKAYTLYKRWLEKQQRSTPPIETFLTSSYYASFIKFANYTQELHILNPEMYVDVMVKANLSPPTWVLNDAYGIYLDHIDKRLDPYDQAERTIKCLGDVADALEIEIGSVFNELTYGDMLDLVNQRQLSPWILFCSKKFKEWVAKLDPTDKTNLMKSIGVVYWQMMLEKNPSVVEDMKTIVNEMGL